MPEELSELLVDIGRVYTQRLRYYAEASMKIYNGSYLISHDIRLRILNIIPLSSIAIAWSA